MKESGHVSLYIADFRSLMSRIGDWGEVAYIHVYRIGLASRLLDQLASYPGNFDTLQELMEITLEFDTRYHERQKEKGIDFPSFPRFEWAFCITDSPKGEDLILGYDFLYHINPIIDWKNGLITYDSSHKDCSGIKSSASNALATAVNSVSLVGELKTPSLPSSVHIPSIMPSQSLLKERDEDFKEIKDVGEDVAISSLHLLQGDMDLPPWRSSGMRRKSQKKLKLC
ncbi:hypothetical protein O181_001474 [Austropuccinia psidii MF-1]|uniref:Uncharacterized protein n=1 Tax=Austropuccinia psidii MF-1 TaxID=1389203 RepID=A0A9Q3BAL1_9BASI|nr:hypothetical protein [Austropuccinia psidii MF-1]